VKNTESAVPDGLCRHAVRRPPGADPDSAFLEKPFTARGLQEAARLLLYGTINPAG
jgi:hypothetical protein